MANDVVNLTVAVTEETVNLTVDETTEEVTMAVTETTETVNLTVAEVGVQGPPGDGADITGIDGGTP